MLLKFHTDPSQLDQQTIDDYFQPEEADRLEHRTNITFESYPTWKPMSRSFLCAHYSYDQTLSSCISGRKFKVDQDGESSNKINKRIGDLIVDEL